VPGGEKRGGHTYKELNELIVALSGSFDVVIDNGKERGIFYINHKPSTQRIFEYLQKVG